MPAHEKISFKYKIIKNNKLFKIGNIEVTAISTAGYNLESMSFIIEDKVLLIDDILLSNGVERPDLKADRDEMIAKERLLDNSLQKLLCLNE